MPSSAAIRLLRRRWSKPSGSRSRRPRSSTSKGVLRFAAARWSWRSGRHSLAGVRPHLHLPGRRQARNFGDTFRRAAPRQRRQPARRVRLRQCQTDSIEGRGLPLRQLASRATGKPTDRQISRNTTGRPGGAGGLGRIMRLEPARRLSVLRARCRSVRGSVAISSASRVRSAVEASGNADQHRHGVHHQSNIRR